MRQPNFDEEKKLWRKGYPYVAGVDEAGRGPLAGPVVAAALTVRLNPKSQILKQLIHLKDSKKLTAKKREEFFKILTSHPQIEWGIGKVGHKVIDQINILEATKLAMKRAVKKLNEKLKMKNEKLKVDYLILDGNFKLPIKNIPQKAIIKADEKVFSCKAASIIAKVHRDRIMQRCHRKYPQYGFDRHKGYGTKQHFEMLEKYGVCDIHRRSFRPVSLKPVNRVNKSW